MNYTYCSVFCIYLGLFYLSVFIQLLLIYKHVSYFLLRRSSDLVMTSGILHEQSACAVLQLAGARFMLECIGVTAMFEATEDVLSMLYCLKVTAVALYLCDIRICLFI